MKVVGISIGVASNCLEATHFFAAGDAGADNIVVVVIIVAAVPAAAGSCSIGRSAPARSCDSTVAAASAG